MHPEGTDWGVLFLFSCLLQGSGPEQHHPHHQGGLLWPEEPACPVSTHPLSHTSLCISIKLSLSLYFSLCPQIISVSPPPNLTLSLSLPLSSLSFSLSCLVCDFFVTFSASLFLPLALFHPLSLSLSLSHSSSLSLNFLPWPSSLWTGTQWCVCVCPFMCLPLSLCVWMCVRNWDRQTNRREGGRLGGVCVFIVAGEGWGSQPNLDKQEVGAKN